MNYFGFFSTPKDVYSTVIVVFPAMLMAETHFLFENL